MAIMQCHQDMVNHKTTSPSTCHICLQWVSGQHHRGGQASSWFLLGSQEYTDRFVKGKVKEWCNELEKLSSIAETQSHAAYAAITHGLADKWNYLSRSTQDIRECLDPLETTLWTKVIPTLTGRPPSNTKCNLLQHSDAASRLKQSLSSYFQRSMALAQESGSSSWLPVLPVTEFGFTLHKSAFCDALCLRYGWLPSCIPIECECGTQFSVEHVLSCLREAFHR